MQILQISFWTFDNPLISCARKNAMSIGINKTSMAMKICRAEPEYQIIRDNEAKTAVSSVAVTLPQEKSGDKKR